PRCIMSRMPSSVRDPVDPVHVPHTPLRGYYGRDQQRCAWVVDLFDRTAPDYERIESFMAMGSGSRYRRRALSFAGLQPGMSVIDVGTGTGLVAREAAHLVGPQGSVLGVDPSAAMLANAPAVAGVRLAVGRAESIPAADASADFL